jgi:hypothetical protein
MPIDVSPEQNRSYGIDKVKRRHRASSLQQRAAQCRIGRQPEEDSEREAMHAKLDKITKRLAAP